ncbi:LOG family protein [Nocardioides sp.]|uniref:LOG family protein n=1 Tax=Nocardioides sp. TaxID=35761 RepID=UPI003D150CEA
MRKKRGRVVAVESLGELDRRLARGTSNLSGWHLHDLDLREYDEPLRRMKVAGALFLGCTLSPALEADLRVRGATVFPDIPDVPVNTFRTALYSPSELYGSGPYADSLDAQIYAWSRQSATPDMRMAQALHDHAVDEALGAWVAGRHVVGVMGGHAHQRDEVGYRDAVLLGHGLADHATVATGGGPGAMEAANLGAWLGSADSIEPALDILRGAPAFRPDIGAWAAAAFAVRDQWPEGRDSLGIPTWHYGHEPPNAMASTIAKYFRNATREAILLGLCDRGIVFLPGAGGTVQEIFQDACENYYADESSVAPMVLVGRDYWTVQAPAWPLLRSLAKGRPMESYVHLVDTVEEAVAVIA